MRYIIGLTGEIASGKSTVSKLLQQKGLLVIDADRLSRGVMQKNGAAYDEVVQYFGKEYVLPSGEIDRKKLGAYVFSQKEELKKLEKLTHPHVIALADALLRNAKGMVVLDVPLLFEANMQHLCDEIWVITAPAEMRLQRVIKRDGLLEAEAKDRISCREEIKYRGIIPTYWIKNNETQEALQEKILLHLKEAEAKWQKKR